MAERLAHEEVSALTDKYFTKTANVVRHFGDKEVTYGVFMRRAVVCAIQPAIEFILAQVPGVKITRHAPEGSIVPPETPIFSYTGSMAALVELETLILQKVGLTCVCAYNAWKMCSTMPRAAFLDMHARHGTGPDFSACAAYGASIGSTTAKLHGAKGFIGGSTDINAACYGTESGMGTMPHALIGYAGSTLKAVEMFIEANPNDTNIVALVDYFGTEIDDALQVAEWFRTKHSPRRRLSVRLDTHGGRFLQGLDYDKSVEVMSDWTHSPGRWPVVQFAMGDEAYEIATDSVRDQVARLLFGTGVSAAGIVHMRKALNAHGHSSVGIVASSGFNLRKCTIMERVHAPIDVVGTGSFLPDTLSETYATADIYEYDGTFSVKEGRDRVFNKDRL